MSTTLVSPLDALRLGDLSRAGGKAASLGELLAAGFPVPEGFCLTTAAWAQVVDSAGEALAAPLSALGALELSEPPSPRDSARLQALAQAARQAIEEAPVPPAVQDACREAYRALEARCSANVAVAVRSSATAEDLPDASFAGQQDTTLNVTGADAVLAAVRRCWGSLFTERAVSYRCSRRMDHRAVGLAVVVQRLVPSEVAGVLFTADPVSGRRGLAIIDASPGLGEAVVSGLVNPDHFEVLTATGEVLRSRLGDKRVAILPDVQGGTRREERGASREPCLSHEELRSLSALGQRVEAHAGQPQDIEWALGPGRALFVLQSRPITTLFPVPRPAPFPQDRHELRVFFNFSVAQGVLRPMTPLGLSVWKYVVGQAQAFLGAVPADREAPPVLTEAAGRLFMDVTPLVRSDVGRRAISFLLSRMEPRTARLLESLSEEPRLSVRPVGRRWLFPRLLRLAVLTRIPFRLLHAVLFPTAARHRVEQAGDAALRLGDGAPQEPRQALELVERVLAPAARLTLFRAGPVFVAGMLCLQVARRVLRGVATREELDTVLRGLPFNITTEMDVRLAHLAREVSQDPSAAAMMRGRSTRELTQQFLEKALPPTLQAGLEAFLVSFGARGVSEIDVGVARWREDPTQLLASVVGALSAGEATDPERQFHRGAEEAEAMVQELTRRARGASLGRGWLASFLFSRVRGLAGLREAPKFYIVRLFDRARQLLAGIGAGLHARGLLSAPEGVFFLTLTEVHAALDGTSFVTVEALRRERWALELQRRHLPRVLLSDGTEVSQAADESLDGALQGTAASAGSATGVARVVMDPSQARLEAGEVLVAPSTDPGWTPLFLTASALVMEMGGAMSHGAVVAREYGIPAVVGVSGAIERIKTGDRIVVDGTRGVVLLQPPRIGSGSPQSTTRR